MHRIGKGGELLAGAAIRVDDEQIDGDEAAELLPPESWRIERRAVVATCGLSLAALVARPGGAEA